MGCVVETEGKVEGDTMRRDVAVGGQGHQVSYTLL